MEALNHALRDIPADQLRMHLCWGNYEGPHHLDTPLEQIIQFAFEARPSALSFEAANPRHGHEWTLFAQVELPEGKRLIPGVLDSTTNFIEHPDLVRERIVRYAGLVGRENVIVGTDCGFSHLATTDPKVDPRIAWAKLEAMAEGGGHGSRPRICGDGRGRPGRERESTACLYTNLPGREWVIDRYPDEPWVVIGSPSLGARLQVRLAYRRASTSRRSRWVALPELPGRPGQQDRHQVYLPTPRSRIFS